MILFTIARSIGQSQSKLKFQAVNTLAKSYNCNFVRNFADKMGLPRVFFDMSADGTPVGRIVIEVSIKSAHFEQHFDNKIADLKNVVVKK